MSSYTAITRSNRRQTDRQTLRYHLEGVSLLEEKSFLCPPLKHTQTDRHTSSSICLQSTTHDSDSTGDVPQRVLLKLCMTVRRCMHDKAAVLSIWRKKYCISSSDTDSRQRLRSASRHLLSVPRHRRTLGRRAFAVSGPTACNSLPHDLPNPSCYDSYFGRFLKSILFSY